METTNTLIINDDIVSRSNTASRKLDTNLLSVLEILTDSNIGLTEIMLIVKLEFEDDSTVESLQGLGKYEYIKKEYLDTKKITPVFKLMLTSIIKSANNRSGITGMLSLVNFLKESCPKTVLESDETLESVANRYLEDLRNREGDIIGNIQEKMKILKESI